jgi:hypothetical protein
VKLPFPFGSPIVSKDKKLLKDTGGGVRGSDASDSYFTITP